MASFVPDSSSNSPTLTLHEDPISAHCYKIRLTASLLHISLKRIQYSILNNETRTPYFLANINNFGRIPVLQITTCDADGGTLEDKFLPESNAASFYLASLSAGALIPAEPLLHAEMLRWMFFEQAHVEPSIATLRYWTRYLGLENISVERKGQVQGKLDEGRKAMECMERHLDRRQWFVGETVTLADVVLFAYTHVADEGGWDLDLYPNLRAWFGRVEGLDGFVKF